MTGLHSPKTQVTLQRTILSMSQKFYSENILNGRQKVLRSQNQLSTMVSRLFILIWWFKLGFTKDGDQTDEYLKRAAPALKERIVYASHRLYATIVDIYGDDDVQEGAEVFSELFAAFLQWRISIKPLETSTSFYIPRKFRNDHLWMVTDWIFLNHWIWNI